MDELLQQFLVEGRDLVAEAQDALVALGRDPASTAALDSLFRAAHTLKGSVALFDMAPAEALLHAAETRLAGFRKGAASLDPTTLDGLVAIIDQTDRWIDTMGSAGALSPDASAKSDQLIALLGSDDGNSASAVETGQSEGPEPDWIATLRARPDFARIDPATARTAFRYTPDADCFFRGEDPLAIAAAVRRFMSPWAEIPFWADISSP